MRSVLPDAFAAVRVLDVSDRMAFSHVSTHRWQSTENRESQPLIELHHVNPCYSTPASLGSLAELKQRPKRAGNWKSSGQGNYFPKLGSTGKVRTFRPFYYYHFHHHHDRRRHHHHHHHHSLGSPPLSFNLLVMSIMSCIVVESPRPTTCSRRPQVRPEQRFSHPCA